MTFSWCPEDESFFLFSSVLAVNEFMLILLSKAVGIF